MRLLRIIGTAGVIALCAVAVAFAALSLLSRGAPSDTSTWAGGYKPFVVLSGSMEPAIRVGSILLVRHVDPVSVKVGDAIMFVTPQVASATPQEPTVTTHRVVTVIADEQGQLSFGTRGDANEDPDLVPVPAANLLGTAVFSVPYLGYLSRFTSTRTGLLVFIIVPALLLILLEVVSMIRARSRKGGSETAQEGP